MSRTRPLPVPLDGLRLREQPPPLAPPSGRGGDAAAAAAAASCQLCGRAEDAEGTLLCDGCEHGFHAACLEQPPAACLGSVDEWFCSTCQAAGVTALLPLGMRAGPRHEDLDERRQAALARARQSLQRLSLPFQVGDVAILSLGRIDPRPAYHGTLHIWPPGFRSAWREPASGVACVSEVLDGGDAGPVFRVSGRRRWSVGSWEEDAVSSLIKDTEHDVLGATPMVADGAAPRPLLAEAATPADAWRKFADAWLQDGGPRTPAPSDWFQAAARDKFGFDLPETVELIEGLPGAECCGSYLFLSQEERESEKEREGEHEVEKGHQEHEKDHPRGQTAAILQGVAVGAGFSAELLVDFLKLAALPQWFSLVAGHVGLYDVHLVWDFLLRSHRLLGLARPLLLQELEAGLTASSTSPQLGLSPPVDDGKAEATLIHVYLVLVKLVYSRLLCQLSQASDGSITVGAYSSSSGNDGGCPVTAQTWPEVARRTFLATECLRRAVTKGGDRQASAQAPPEIAKSATARLLPSQAANLWRTLCGDAGQASAASIESDAQLLAGAEQLLVQAWQDVPRVLAVDPLQDGLPIMTSSADHSTHPAGVIPTPSVALARLPDVEDQQASSNGGSGAEDLALPSSGKGGGDGSSGTPNWWVPLEPVLKLATNVGARIRNCIRAALDAGPPEWARDKLEWAISREIYKGNASGPTKRMAMEVLEIAKNQRPLHLVSPVPKDQPKSARALAVTMRRCRAVLRKVAASDAGRLFHSWDHALPAGRPLDFRVVDARLAAGAYGCSTAAFKADMRQIWVNVRLCFREGTKERSAANQLAQKFERLFHEQVVVQDRAEEHARQRRASSEVPLSTDRAAGLAHTVLSEVELPPAPWEEDGGEECQVCGGSKHVVGGMPYLRCSACGRGYHGYCLEPPVKVLQSAGGPPWHCPSCVVLGRGAQSERGSQSQPDIREHHGEMEPPESTVTGDVRQAWRFRLVEQLCSEYCQLSADDKLRLLGLLCIEAFDTGSLSTQGQPLLLGGAISEAGRQMEEAADGRAMKRRKDGTIVTGTEDDASSSPWHCLGMDRLGRRFWSVESGQGTWRQILILKSSEMVDNEACGASMSMGQWSALISPEQVDEVIAWLANTQPGDTDASVYEQEGPLLKHLREARSAWRTVEPTHLSCKVVEADRAHFQASALLSYEAHVTSSGMVKERRRLARCSCLEPIWSGRQHCQTCHESLQPSTSLTAHAAQCKEFKVSPPDSQALLPPPPWGDASAVWAMAEAESVDCGGAWRLAPPLLQVAKRARTMAPYPSTEAALGALGSWLAELPSGLRDRLTSVVPDTVSAAAAAAFLDPIGDALRAKELPVLLPQLSSVDPPWGLLAPPSSCSDRIDQSGRTGDVKARRTMLGPVTSPDAGPRDRWAPFSLKPQPQPKKPSTTAAPKPVLPSKVKSDSEVLPLPLLSNTAATLLTSLSVASEGLWSAAAGPDIELEFDVQVDPELMVPVLPEMVMVSDKGGALPPMPLAAAAVGPLLAEDANTIGSSPIVAAPRSKPAPVRHARLLQIDLNVRPQSESPTQDRAANAAAAGKAPPPSPPPLPSVRLLGQSKIPMVTAPLASDDDDDQLLGAVSMDELLGPASDVGPEVVLLPPAQQPGAELPTPFRAAEVGELPHAMVANPSLSGVRRQNVRRMSLQPNSQPRASAGAVADEDLGPDLVCVREMLLDIEAALEAGGGGWEEWRGDAERRRAWRRLVKSSTKSVELLQALALLEVMVAGTRLAPSWRLWSSPTATLAAPTAAALVLRVLALDRLLQYKRPSEVLVGQPPLPLASDAAAPLVPADTELAAGAMRPWTLEAAVAAAPDVPAQ
eukprot:SM000268S09732  [mRNA]  locus=s268:53522:62543:+ [translate_table: standard]